MPRNTECAGDSWQQEDMELLSARRELFAPYEHHTVLITGATGFVGSSLVRALLCYNRRASADIRIIAAVRSPEKAEMVFGDLLKRQELTLYVGDLREPVEIEGPVDYLFHTASVTTSKVMVSNPVETIDISYSGTRNILELARRKQVRGMVYVSSMEAFGNPDPTLERVREKDLGYIDLENVRSSYSEGKRICEMLCNAYASEYQVPVRTARLAQTFGAGVMAGDNRVYVQFARSVMQGTDIVMHTDGTSEGNYCYIRDALAGLLLLGDRGSCGEAYTVVNEDNHMQIREMAALAADTLAGGKIRVLYDIPESALTYGYAPSVKLHLSGEKLRALGWQPEVGMTEMYERLMGSMKCRNWK